MLTAEILAYLSKTEGINIRYKQIALTPCLSWEPTLVTSLGDPLLPAFLEAFYVILDVKANCLVASQFEEKPLKATLGTSV